MSKAIPTWAFRQGAEVTNYKVYEDYNVTAGVISRLQ